MHIASAAEAARRAAEVPVSYVVFDVLHLDGNDLTGLPLRDRRRLLEQVLDPGRSWQISPMHDDGETLVEVAAARGMEGVVAKRLDSTYDVGRRTRTWLKVKTRRRQEMRSEEHTSELQSLMRISYAVFCLKKKKKQTPTTTINQHH